MVQCPDKLMVQGLLAFCLFMSHVGHNRGLLASNTFQVTACLLHACISVSAAAAFLAYGITHCQQRHADISALSGWVFSERRRAWIEFSILSAGMSKPVASDIETLVEYIDCGRT